MFSSPHYLRMWILRSKPVSWRLLLFLTGLALCNGVVAAQSPLVLARAPQLSPGVISDLWSPFVERLSKTIDREIVLKVYEERAEFEDDIREGRVDLYFGNPGYGVVGHLLHAYQPLVRSDRKLLEGILVVRKDSDINEVPDLAGKKIAFPAPTAFAASLYLRSRIRADFDLDYEEVFTGSHDNTYRAVLIGRAMAGGGVRRTLEQEDVKLQENLRTIYVTPGIHSHPLMIHPRVAAKIRQAVAKAILDLADSEEGRKLLVDVKLQKPVMANYDRDYRPIESLVKSMYDFLLEKNE